MTPSADPTTTITIPDSLLSVESVADAITICLTAGLRPILIHSPLPDGSCSCGKKNCSKSKGKHPIAKNWQKNEPSLDELLNHIARLKFTPNLGIVLGKQRDGDYLIAVDVDDMKRFEELEEELGPLPETPRCDSGRGFRLFYTAPPQIDVKTLANVTGLGGVPGLDIKVESGQVVVAPSLHQNGARYRWSQTGPVVPLPMQWAMAMIKKPETPKWIENYTPTTLKDSHRARNRAERYLEVAVTGEAHALAACGEGMRNSTLYKSACRMFELCGGLYLGQRWQWVHDELLSAARASGLSEHESRLTLSSAEKRVRETGAIKVPVSLADPGPEPDPNQPAPPAPPPPKKPNRPIVKITPELHETVEQSVRALRTNAKVFQRDGRLVHITKVTPSQSEASPHVEVDDGHVHRQLVAGSPQIHFLSRSVIKSHLTESAIFQKWVESSGRYKAIQPPDDLVSHIHDQGEWDGIRVLTGITETPTLNPDGTIMQKPNDTSDKHIYNETTGYLYIPSGTYPEVKDEDAIQEKAKWAFEFLSESFVDFPYVNDAHRSVPIAAILTLVARPAIAGSIPAILFDASTRGSGKTLQTDIIATITTGRGAPRMNYTSDDIELEKILGGYAIKGSPFICLDNVPTNKPFGGGPLDRCITARDKVDLRILGRSEVPTLSWRSLIMATGNNMTLHGDTSRRVLMARLEPTEESPERRSQFRHNDVLAFVRTQRFRMVSAALLMLRAYWRAGCPDMGCARWGSFEEWSRLIPNAIVFAGGADPMLSRPERDEEVDVETQALSGLLSQLPLLHARLVEMEPDGVTDDGLASRTIIAALYEQDPAWPEFEALRDAVETLCKNKGGRDPDHNTLSYKLRAMRSRVIGGRKLVATRAPSNVTMWKVVTL